ncbi:MAG: hypothetical protein ABI645_12175 [Pseudomonadota bacterium]
MSEAPKSRRTLYILVALFFLPLAASFILYYGVGWRPAGGSIHGELLQPIRQMPSAAEKLLGKWALVYVGNGKCDADCQQALVFARQMRLMLNKEMDRVNRAFLSTGDCCDLAYIDKEHEGLKVYDVSEPEAYAQLMGVLPQEDLRHWLFVIDPLGNIVMRYDVRESPRGLLDDLKKLLKLSHIG